MRNPRALGRGREVVEGLRAIKGRQGPAGNGSAGWVVRGLYCKDSRGKGS